MQTRIHLLILMTAMLIVAAACGDSGTAEKTAATQAPATEAPTTEAAAETAPATTQSPSAAEAPADLAAILPGFWKSSWGEFEFTAEGAFLTMAPGSGGTIKDEGTYQIVGDKLTLASSSDYDTCAGESGTFTYAVNGGDSIRLDLAADGCDERALSLDAKSLSRQASLSAAPQVTTTTTTVPLEEMAVLEASIDGSVVAAGSYVSTSLGVPIRLNLADDVAIFVEDGSFVSIERAGEPTSLTFAEFAGHPTPDGVANHDHDPNDAVPIERATDWVRFFGANEGLLLADSGTDEVGGSIAPWWQFTADETAGGGFDDCPFGDNCFNIAVVDGYGNFLVGEELTVRLWKLDSSDGTVYAWFQALTESFAADLSFGLDILETVTVGG